MALDREKVLQAAQKLVEKKKYDKALLEYRKLIEADPTDARTLLKVGDLQAKLGALPDAVATYDAVGRLYAQQGFALKAIAVFKQVREIIAKQVPQLEERFAHVIPRLAELYQQLGLVSDALATLDELAVRLQRQARDPEAIGVFQRIVALDPTNPLPHLRLAEALSRVREIDGAVAEFRIAASQLAGLGRRDDALKVLERLLHHKFDTDQARVAAELYLQRGGSSDVMLALGKLQLCFQADQKNLDVLALLARAFEQLGQRGKAVEVRKEMAKIARDTKRVQLFKELVQHLAEVAPHDETVAQLTQQARTVPPPGASLPPPPFEDAPEPLRAPAPLDDASDPSDVESLDDGDVEALELDDAEYESVEADDYAHDARTGVVAEAPELDPGLDVGEHVAQVLGDAASFRRVGLADKVVETLRDGLELAPRALELLEAYRDALLEVGRTEESIEAMLVIARVYADADDVDGAARSLQDVLAYDRRNRDALGMLEELGYEVVDDDAPGYDDGAAPNDDLGADGGEAPLPAYDLDAGGGYGSLPSFPLDAERGAPSVPPPAAATAPEAAAGLEDALEESEFFVSRGLYEEARAILAEQLAVHPSHPILGERLAELDAHIRAQQESGTRERPRHGEDRAFDIAASLDALEGLDTFSGGADLLVPEVGNVEQIDVEEVFSQFKEKVAQQIGLDDSQSHYDLGVAYKEMLLLEDAIREFEVAARDPKKQCVCWSMIGSIELERGNLAVAIEAFTKALEAPLKEPQQETMLCYELGAAYETRRMNKEALAHYQRAARRDPGYRDVMERVERLGRAEPKLRAAVGADDEFDRAFDGLLGDD